jgi:hypothetical protein
MNEEDKRKRTDRIILTVFGLVFIFGLIRLIIKIWRG